MKIYILTEVNAWTELLYIQSFPTKEKAQDVMKAQVEDEIKWWDEEYTDYEIHENDAYCDDGEYDDRVKYSWNITEIEA